MKKIAVAILLGLMMVHFSESRKKKQDQTDQGKTDAQVEEMNIRARGTFILNYVDQFDKLGVFNKTSPDNNGDEGRNDVASFQPDSAGRRKLRKEFIDLANLASSQKEIKKAADKLTVEAINLLGNNMDPRSINIFNSKALELPVLCKQTLSEEELIMLGQRATNMSYCWVNATGHDNLGKYTYLDFPYLGTQEFASFYVCATKKAANLKKQTSTTKTDETNEDMDGEENEKYIKVKDVQKYPEALWSFVLGKRAVGMPISWLRFMVFICSEGGTYEKSAYVLQEGDEGYSDSITDAYKDKLDKMIKHAKTMIQKRLDDRSKGVIYSGTRFGKKKAGEKIQEHQIKIKKSKKYQKKLLKASHNLDMKFKILKSAFEQFVTKKDRRLKKHLHHHKK